MWFGKRKKLDPALVSELESLDYEAANLKLREAVESKRKEVAILNEDLHYFIGHYLTSTSAWFLLADKSEHSLKHITRKALDEMFSDDFDTYSIKQIAMERYAVGAFHWIGTWGSNGP